MPTVDASAKDLQALIGKKFSAKELEEALLYAKAEVDAREGDTLKIDVKDTNRPDLWSAEGIAREIRARIGKEKGLPEIRVAEGKTKLFVERSVKDVRPLIAACVARNAKVGGQFLVQMINLQEKVSGNFGRGRAEAAIGIYDFGRMKPPVYYRAYEPHALKFVPLEFRNEMDLDEILELHPKGREYAHLLKGRKKYPVVIDSAGMVASMPPIINSEATGKVSPETRNLFVEVTGMKAECVLTALNVMAASLAERGARLESVEVLYPGGKKWKTPDFEPKKIKVEFDYVRKIAGMQLTNKQIIELLVRARYAVKAKGNRAEVFYPAYRNDILHQIDVVEDALISYGYNKIKPEPIRLAVQGSERDESLLGERVREACIGIGLQEVLTLTLTSKEKQEKMAGLKDEQFAEIRNYASLNYQVFRKRIFPELLEFLNRNKRFACPQNVFEIGKVVLLNPKSETGVDEPEHLCIALCGKGMNFTRIKSCLGSLARDLGWKHELEETSHPAFERGRAAEILAGKRRGIIGEVNAKTLANFGLGDVPVALLEIEI